MNRTSPPILAAPLAATLFALGRSFCDDVSYGRVRHSYLQGACKHQADHDDGAGQHADRGVCPPEMT
jgi:hypothetical protein